MQTESKDPVPTSAEQDIFLRWVANAKDRDRYYTLDFNTQVTSTGTVFGKPAHARAVHCMGNSFIDLWVDLNEHEYQGVRVIIYYSSLQSVQVYCAYGNQGAPVNMDRCVPFQAYALEKLIAYIEELVA